VPSRDIVKWALRHCDVERPQVVGRAALKGCVIHVAVIIIIIIIIIIPSHKNVIQKEAEKKLKYKHLSIEIQRMRNIKCFVIPVIIGAT
jgi:uncharacterized membrane protein